MKHPNEIVREIKNDPIKLKRTFTLVWVVAYGMLILGAFIIIWVLLNGQTL